MCGLWALPTQPQRLPLQGDPGGRDALPVQGLPVNLWRWGHTDQEIVDAMVTANGDRARLADLVRRGRVTREDGANVLAHPEVARPFIRDIQGRITVNLAIKPKKGRRR